MYINNKVFNLSKISSCSLIIGGCVCVVVLATVYVSGEYICVYKLSHNSCEGHFCKNNSIRGFLSDV